MFIILVIFYFNNTLNWDILLFWNDQRCQDFMLLATYTLEILHSIFLGVCFTKQYMNFFPVRLYEGWKKLPKLLSETHPRLLTFYLLNLCDVNCCVGNSGVHLLWVKNLMMRIQLRWRLLLCAVVHVPYVPRPAYEHSQSYPCWQNYCKPM